MRQINDAGLDLIQSFETCVLHPYDDGVGVMTIGWGHAIKPDESFTTITQLQADDLLRADLLTAERAVENAVNVELTDNQYAAVCSLVFNIGSGNFASSTLLRDLNEGDFANAGLQFLKWNKGGGKVLGGLVRRREAEKKLFETA